MSQQPDKQNSDAYPDCHAPPQSAADCKTPTSTLSKSDTKVQPTSQQISALDITEVFTAASSGNSVALYKPLALLTNLSFAYRTVG